MSPRKTSTDILVVSGLGNAVGTGASVARLFAAELGYRVALVARPRRELELLRDEINQGEGGEAEVFALDTYDFPSIKDVFERIKSHWKDGRVRCAVWNTGAWSNIPFMDIKESDIQNSVNINIVAATAFAQCSVACFVASTPAGQEGGTLIMTGATSATRGAHSFGAFSAGKSGARALSQSIAREYGPKGVHVCYVVVDGTIITKRTKVLFGKRNGEGWLDDEAQRLSPDSIAKTYLFLHQQTKDCWTLELDLRPSKEKF